MDRIVNWVGTILWSWHEAKLFVEHSIAFSSDSLHILASVAVLLSAAALLRRPVSNWWPWSLVLLLTCANEAIDLWIERWPNPGMQYGESAKDFLLTMALPTLLLITARLSPLLYVSPIRCSPGTQVRHGRRAKRLSRNREDSKG